MVYSLLLFSTPHVSSLHSFWFTSRQMRTWMRFSADQILCVERTFPYSLLILGDFNKGNLSQELPKYK